MGGVASKPGSDPDCTLQVIGAGFSRTGTVTMALALERLLEGPVCHGGTQMHLLEEKYPRQWVEVYRARHDRPKLLAALRNVTRGFVGITDMPGVHFVEELCEIYPEAKVICVRRDPKRWLQSAQHMSNKMTAWYMPLLTWPMPATRWFATWLELAVERTGEMGLLPFDEEYLTRYNEHVARVVPPERLFWMEMSDGWAPLCKMLDKPIPEEPFPRANDSEAADELIELKIKAACMAWSGILGAVGLAAWVGLRAFKMSRRY
ncbi:hypothetical protein Daus18300_002267 [Diaporthe australafricana]|uniref:NAD dependent epimerase/dehydratase n=1 Tax=Diaporthe australafricana TaxID=127596 RepID=A0ABR3XPN7_9PEZI